MKILIFADTHLTEKFNVKLFDYIAPLALRADQIIINGDFWDCHLTNFDQFVTSRWSTLFPLLQKKTIYLYGNHDPARQMDKRVKLFSKIQAKSWQLKVGDQTLLLEHGDRVAPEFQEKHHLVTNLTNRFTPWLYPRLDGLLFKSSLLPRIYQKYMEFRHGQLLKQLKSFSQDHCQPKTLRVFGHSHLPCHNQVNQGFICLGACRFDQFNYLWIKDSKIFCRVGRL